MAKSPDKKPSKPASKVKVQYAALPWRRAEDAQLEILVITSRDTHRAVIPKGWPIKGLAPNMTAMREAYEEAGIEGYISMIPIGGYSYVKRMPKGREQDVRVEVFGLEVSEEHAGFKEMNQRTKMWVSQGLAAEMVDELELRALIAGFDPSRTVPQ
ncbi:MAG: NUDIX hydrolase [Caulobacteraceae bacterium]